MSFGEVLRRTIDRARPPLIIGETARRVEAVTRLVETCNKLLREEGSVESFGTNLIQSVEMFVPPEFRYSLPDEGFSELIGEGGRFVVVQRTELVLRSRGGKELIEPEFPNNPRGMMVYMKNNPTAPNVEFVPAFLPPSVDLITPGLETYANRRQIASTLRANFLTQPAIDYENLDYLLRIAVIPRDWKNWPVNDHGYPSYPFN